MSKPKPQKQIDNSSLVDLQPEWLIRQMIQHYLTSTNDRRAASTRDRSRQKFLNLASQLLPLVGRERLVGSLTWSGYACLDPREGIALINNLAAERQPQTPPTAPAAAHSALPSGERATITKLLAAGLEPLLEALKLLQGAKA